MSGAAPATRLKSGVAVQESESTRKDGMATVNDGRGESTSGAIIEARNLRKRYGALTAVDGFDIVVEAGEIFGILGPNGAGKTTTLEMIEGLREPDEGSITLGGYDSVRHLDEIRRLIGVQLQTTALFDYLTCAEILDLFASLYDMPDAAHHVDQLLGMVGLAEKRGARVDQLSGGQQQRLSIALGLVNRPRIIFLDEPTTGLDPGARRELWQTIRTIRDEGSTVVLTTHYMEEAEYLCDRVAIMDFGRVIALDSPRALVRNLEIAATISAEIAEGRFDPASLEVLPGVTAANSRDGVVTLATSDTQATLVGLLDLASRHRVRLVDLRSTQASLEDVFLHLTGRAYEEREQAEQQAEEAEEPRRRRWRR
jgi:ABC-2 type transport system ATP-binding protein